jgi:hypothetical protein
MTTVITWNLRSTRLREVSKSINLWARPVALSSDPTTLAHEDVLLPLCVVSEEVAPRVSSRGGGAEAMIVVEPRLYGWWIKTGGVGDAPKLVF